MPTSNATSRFSDRVENYVRYRPGYPAEALQALKDECGLTPEHVIADIGFGHGHLDADAVGKWQSGLRGRAQPGHAAGGRATAGRVSGGLPAWRGRRRRRLCRMGAWISSLRHRRRTGLIVARARREFVRILKPAGWLVLLWNERLTDSTPFLRDYEAIAFELWHRLRRRPA